MLKALITFNLIFYTILSLAQTDDAAARDKVLREYGDKRQYDSVMSEREEERIKIKIKTYQQRLKEPLIKNQKSYNALNPIEKDRYLERRKVEQEDMSQYILKHHALLEIEQNSIINSEKEVDNTKELSTAIEEKPLKLEEQLDKELSSLGDVKINESVFTNLLSEKNKKAAFEMLKVNPFSTLSEAEIESMILLRTDGSPVNKLLRENHKLRDTVVHIIQDKNAIPSMISILNRPDALKKYALACLVVVVIGFFMNLTNSSTGIFKRILYKIVLSLGVLLTNFAIFYLIFEKELAPTVLLIKKYYFS